MVIAQKTNDPVTNLALDTIEIKKQALVFVNTKRSAEKVAENISKKTNLKSKALDDLSDKILKALPRPTKQCERLAACAKKGSVFHHAGLHHKQRQLIEDAFRNGTIKIISCTPTLCLSGDTLIWNDLSNTRIDEFRNKKVLALSNNNLIHIRPKKIEKISNNSNLIEVRSSAGYSIKTSPNHRFLIKRDGNVKLVAAKDILKKDKIATAGRLVVKKPRRPSIKSFIKENDKNLDCEFDDSLFYFIGAMLGDGYSGAEMNRKRVKYKGTPNIVGIDEEIFSNIKKICERLDINCRQTNNHNRTPQLVLGKNKWFREFLCRCGIEKGKNKHINDKLMRAPLTHIAHLLSGLFDTDGFVQKGHNIGFSNISEKLIKQTQRSLLRFGIVSYLKRKPAASMQIYDKEYKTLPCFELIISQKKSIMDYYRFIGFKVKRKQSDLIKLVGKIISNAHHISCENCNYKIYKDLFSGRNKDHKKWGTIKYETVMLLGKHGELGSKELTSMLKSLPRKKETRLNHHYELIKKRRIGNKSNTEWLWSLNPIGQWTYDNILSKNKPIESFFKNLNCPLCKSKLEWTIKKGWRFNDFDGDIFWDVIRNVKICPREKFVYDVVLPNTPKNNHMFVANGFIVHNSAGVDLPAYRAIIRDVKRFGMHGMAHIPVLEFLQMAGRAGRPKYDNHGEAIVVAQTESHRDYIIDHYLYGEPEDIFSKLAVEPVLRTYLLSLISSRIINTDESIIDFFSRTFWAHQYQDIDRMEKIINKMLDLLVDWEFLQEVKEGYRATAIGKRVAELYLDPLTAHNFLIALERAPKTKLKAISFLHLVSNTLEMRPLLRVKQKEYDEVTKKYALFEAYLLQHEPNMFEPEYDSWLSSLKTSYMLEDWIDEKHEEYILEHYDCRPGETRSKIDRADWLLYACHELSRLMGYKELLKEVVKVRLRLKYGVKEELLPLVRLQNIGRARARLLHRNGIKDLGGIRKTPIEKLSKILGAKLAKSVKEQVNA